MAYVNSPPSSCIIDIVSPVNIDIDIIAIDIIITFEADTRYDDVRPAVSICCCCCRRLGRLWLIVAFIPLPHPHLVIVYQVHMHGTAVAHAAASLHNP